MDRIGLSGQSAETKEYNVIFNLEGSRAAGERLIESRCLYQEGGQEQESGTRWSD